MFCNSLRGYVYIFSEQFQQFRKHPVFNVILYYIYFLYLYKTLVLLFFFCKFIYNGWAVERVDGAGAVGAKPAASLGLAIG